MWAFEKQGMPVSGIYGSLHCFFLDNTFIVHPIKYIVLELESKSYSVFISILYAGVE